MTTDERWLVRACDLAALCEPSETAFSVGAVIVGAGGVLVAEGFSREGGDPALHAEQAALAKAVPGTLAGGTVYSSLEPCARRASAPVPCARLIIAAGLSRVVYAWREPDTFVPGADGAALLRAAGVEVVHLEEYAGAARRPNAHLL